MTTLSPIPRGRPLLLAAAVGAFAQLSQILVFRELLDSLRGGELLIGVILGSHLLATALGTLIGSRPSWKQGWMSSSLPFVATLALLVQLASARILATTAITPLPHSLILAAVLTFPAAFCAGLIFGRLFRGSLADSVRLYQADTWGAVAAGTAFTLLFAHTQHPFNTAILTGAIFVLVAAFCNFQPGRMRLPTLHMLVAISLGLLSLLSQDTRLDRLKFSRQLPGYIIRESILTPQGRLAALASPDASQLSIYRGPHLLGSLESPPPADEQSLADLLACRHAAPKRIALIGAAVSSLPRQFSRHAPDEIALIEADPALFDILRHHTHVLDEVPALQTISIDPRLWARTPDQFDIILLSPGHLDTLLSSRLATADFFHDLAGKLAADGILAITLPTFGGTGEYVSPAMQARDFAVAAALRESLPNFRALPAAGCLLIATNAKPSLSLDPLLLAQRLSLRPGARPELVVAGQRSPIDPRDYFDSLFGGILAIQPALNGPPGQPAIDRFEAPFRSSCAKPNRDNHPTALLASLCISSSLTTTSPTEITRLHPLAITLPTLLLLFIASHLANRPGQAAYFRPMLFSFAAGLFAMAIEVALLHTYQALRGNLHHEIGLLLATIMAGLAIGARLLRFHDKSEMATRTLMAGMSLLCLLLPVIARTHSIVLLWCTILIAALLVGAVFTQLVRQCPDHAGAIYSADLIGSAGGALLCGTFWLPMLGLFPSMLTVAALLAISLIPRFGSRRTPVTDS